MIDQVERCTNERGEVGEWNHGRVRVGWLTMIALAGLIGGSFVSVGCQKTALRAKDERSQFDRYDQARNQKAQPFLEDEFGRRTPNLRDRLLVRDK